MTEDQNNKLARFDITDPSDRRDEPADEVAVDESSGTGETDESSGENTISATPTEDLSEFLDEVAGKRILDLQKEITKLRSLVEQRESAAKKAEPVNAIPAPARADDKVAKRQSQFVSRTSGREGTSLSPVERATRSVEELMRKRGIL